MADIRVALVDGQVMMRESLAAQLDRAEGIRVVWQGSEGVDLLTYYASCLAADRPQVVVMAVWLQGKTGVTTTKRIKKLNQSIRVIGLTLVPDMQVVRLMMEAGAYGCVQKTEQFSVLTDLIRASWYGTDPTDPATRAALDDYFRKRKAWPTASGLPADDRTVNIMLTVREHEVLRYVCHAYDNRTIGLCLGISGRTVQTHLTHIYGKLRVRGRAEAILVALRNQWISLEF